MLERIKFQWQSSEELELVKKFIGDKNEENAKQITKIMNDAGLDCEAIIVDLVSIHLFEKCSFKKDKKTKKGWSYSLQIDS